MAQRVALANCRPVSRSIVSRWMLAAATQTSADTIVHNGSQTWLAARTSQYSIGRM